MTFKRIWPLNEFLLICNITVARLVLIEAKQYATYSLESIMNIIILVIIGLCNNTHFTLSRQNTHDKDIHTNNKNTSVPWTQHVSHTRTRHRKEHILISTFSFSLMYQYKPMQLNPNLLLTWCTILLLDLCVVRIHNTCTKTTWYILLNCPKFSVFLQNISIHE